MPDSKPLASLSSGLLARKGGARPAMRRQNVISPASGEHPTQEDLGWNDMGYDVDPPKEPLASAIPDDDDCGDERKSGILSAAIPEVVKQQDILTREYTENTANNSNASAQIAPDMDGGPVKAPKAMSAPFEAVAESHSEEESTPPSPQAVDTQNTGPSPLLRKKISAKDTMAVHENVVEDISEPEQEQPEKELTAAHAILSKKPANKAAQAPEVIADVQPRKRSVAKPQNAAGKRAAFTLRLERERHLRLRLACAIRNQSAQNMVTEALDAFLANVPELEAVTNNLPETAQNRTKT
jgi:hypothetical protein